MGVVTSILEALRRIGSRPQRNALRRLDAALEGKQVVGYERLQLRDPSGDPELFVGVTLPVPETVELLGDDEVRLLRENARYGLEFLGSFGIKSGNDWTLDDLDHAFSAWQATGDKSTYTDNYVMEVLGAMFGEYCVRHLDMRWIKLTDQDGSTLAIEGVSREFRGFPFQSVLKRINDSEHEFFRPIFSLLRQFSIDAPSRRGAT